MDPNDSLPFSQKSATGLYPELEEFSPHTHGLLLEDPF
jgi:hypothetical protein